MNTSKLRWGRLIIIAALIVPSAPVIGIYLGAGLAGKNVRMAVDGQGGLVVVAALSVLFLAGFMLGREVERARR